MSTAESTVECRVCGEINQPGTIACARCGQTLLSADQMKDRRAQIELWKREAERESVGYPTLANQFLGRFSGKPQVKGAYFGSISNYRKRIGLLCLLVPVLIAVLLYAAKGR
ncbi:MAG TPA: hypothetical protein VII60_03190 [Acidimicrobiales bacterium]